MTFLSLLPSHWKLSSAVATQRQIRRWRCSFKYFAIQNEKTAMPPPCLCLWMLCVIVLVSFPSWGGCRPLDANEGGASNESAKLANLDYVYGRIGIPSSSAEDSDDIAGEHFQFRREPVDKKNANLMEDPKLSNLEIVKVIDDTPLLSNGSMIVHVIVTSSSSSSSSSSEIDEENGEADEKHRDQHVILMPEEEIKRANLESTPPLPVSSSQFNLEQSKRPSEDFEIELEQLPKSTQNESRFPPDIFSAFYKAFTQNPQTTTTINNKDDFFSLQSFSTSTTDKPFTTFSVKPQFRTRPQHNLFLYQQRRRRLFRNRQQEERKISEFPSSDSPVQLQETERKLEELAKKIDKSELERISPSPSSPKEITAKPLSQPSQFHLSPSKIAVSVAVTHSKSIAPSVIRHEGKEENVEENKAHFSSLSDGESASFTFQRRTFKQKPKQNVSLPETNRQHDNFSLQDHSNIISSDSSSFIEVTNPDPPQRRKITRTVSGQIGDPSQSLFNVNLRFPSGKKSSSPITHSTTTTTSTTTPSPLKPWQEQVWSQPAQIWGIPAKVWGEPERVWNEAPVNSWKAQKRNKFEERDDELMQSDQPSPEEEEEKKAVKNEEDAPQGTFVILGDDENEGDSIDGDLGRPLMLHHFTIPPSQSQSPQSSKTVSVSTSVSSSVSSSNKNFAHLSRKAPSLESNDSLVVSGSSNYDVNKNSNNSSESSLSPKKTGKKFGYVIEGSNVRKYRVEERTPDGYIVGEYGILSQNNNAFLRGVRYEADGTINPRLIHEALMKFLSLR